MVKYILALSLIASTARANVASDAETKQKLEQQSHDLQAGVPASYPTYWPTYWPTYFPTEEFEEPVQSDGERASAGFAEEVKETRYYSSPPPPEPSDDHVHPPSDDYVEPKSWGSATTLESTTSWDTAPMWDDDGWDSATSSGSTTSWDVAPMWDDDAWESLPSSKAGKMGKRSKCSKRGKVSFSTPFERMLHVMIVSNRCF